MILLKISKIKLNLKKTKKTLLLEFLQQSIDEENTLRIWMGVDSLKKKVRDKSNVILLMNDYKIKINDKK